MKYVITGSLGNISRPVVKQLVASGHDVTVISSNSAKTKEIETLGAKAAIGSIEDRAFLTQVFGGADAVYLMIPPNWATEDFPAYQKLVADNYAFAVKENKIPYAVQLSSVGAHLRKGAGPIDGVAYLEEQLKKIPGLNLVILRPSYFYTNLYAMIPLIKQAGIMGSNFGNTEEKMILVHPADIADEAAKYLLDHHIKGHHIKYVSSDERHPAELAGVIGNAINNPELNWVTFGDEDTRQAMLQAGLKNTMATLYTEMGKAFREGLAQEDYFKQQQTPAGKIKLEDFAREFAAAYQQQEVTGHA